MGEKEGEGEALLLHNLSVAGFAATAPLVGEPLAEDSIFDIFAYGSKTSIWRRVYTSSVCFADSFPSRGSPYASRAKNSGALTPENVTVCQGLPY